MNAFERGVRQALLMRGGVKLTQRQTAERFHVSLATAKRDRARIRRLIREAT